MLWSQIVDRASVPFEPSDEIKVKAKKYGEEAQQDFAYHTKSYERTRGVYIDKDERKIDLPEDFIELASHVEFRNRVIGIYPEHEMFPRRNSDGSYRTGTPQWYEIKGNSLMLYPSPSSVGRLLFDYVATVNNLDDSATAYKRLNYTNLLSGFWVVGKEIQGRTSNATATIEEDINDNKTGTLVISNITGTFQASEQLVQLDEEQAMNLQEQSSWENLLANWDTIGLGARATSSGLTYSYAKAGDKPAILESYHPMLIDYIKAMLYEDEGRYDISDRHMGRYTRNRDLVKGQFQSRQQYGAGQVKDVL
jgi:hypothetical protein|tara:strand:+ start:206 stop:1129 length:924 start_codon:yes stop_codon:yes gene_type:complete